MSEKPRLDPPSAFVAHWIGQLAARCEGGRALDVAMGRGRHAVTLADAGWRAFGVDRRYDAVRDGVAAVRERGRRLHGWCADLTAAALPADAFDLIVVARYLQRDLFPSLCRALAPGGHIVYETFTVAQRTHGRGPTSPDHLLEPGELRAYFDGLDVIFEEEVNEPEAVARLVARKPR